MLMSKMSWINLTSSITWLSYITTANTVIQCNVTSYTGAVHTRQRLQRSLIVCHRQKQFQKLYKKTVIHIFQTSAELKFSYLARVRKKSRSLALTRKHSRPVYCLHLYILGSLVHSTSLYSHFTSVSLSLYHSYYLISSAIWPTIVP